MTESELEACTELLGYSFKDSKLLNRALTHSSSKGVEGDCNERQEFLGDAILGMVISEYLFNEFPKYSEGDLTRIKSVVVSRPVLAESLHSMQLEKHIRVGRGLGQRKLPLSVLANVFEAVIAAIYRDSGLDDARDFILRNLMEHIRHVVHDRYEKNHKSLLQQYAQKEMAATPSYRVVSQSGPDHAKLFSVVAVINGNDYVSGEGYSKKEAEQRAAEQTLNLLLKNDGGDKSTVNEDPSA